VQTDVLDQGQHLRLGTAEQDAAAPRAQAARQHGEIEHHGRVGEDQLGEVDDDIRLGTNGPDQCLPPSALRGTVLIAAAAQGGRDLIEINDAPKPTQNGGLCARGNPPKLRPMATVDEVTDALRDVIDPELGLDFVELGLIYDVEVEDSTVRVTYTLTSPGCPIGPQVSEQIEEFVLELEGVDEVQPTMTFSPPWTPERMSEDAKFALGF
jgi:metal-sulfur cluster biosynthetic enzyme